MRTQVVDLGLVTKHDVAGSEAERFASSLREGDQYALLNISRKYGGIYSLCIMFLIFSFVIQ